MRERDSVLCVCMRVKESNVKKITIKFTLIISEQNTQESVAKVSPEKELKLIFCTELHF